MRIVAIDPGTTNLAVCVLDRHPDDTDDTYPARIMHWELIDLRQTQPAGCFHENVVREFARRSVLTEGVTDVVIEAQGVARAPIQCIAAAIHAFYATIAVLKCPEGIRIHVVSGVHKLKVYQGDVSPPPRIKKGSYAYNKRMSEKHAKAMLGDMDGSNTTHLEWLSGHAKQDDLCDAVLLGMWGAQNNKKLQERPPITQIHSLT